jgi:zinc protease
MAEEQVYTEKLDNGITVIISENHTAPVAACNFWVKTGAAFETDSEKGLSHFLEHMMFKGTEKRPVGQIDKEVKELGGYNNAFTSYDATNFVIVLPSDQIDKAIDIEYDALSSSVFDKEEMDKEREVILAELYRGLDNPDVFLWQKFMNLAFDKYYRDPIIGFAGNLKDYTRDDLVKYYTKYYVPENLIIVVSGDVDKAKIMANIRGSFGKLPVKASSAAAVTKTAEGLQKQGFNFKSYSGAIDGRYLAIGFKIPDALSQDIPKLEILARVLGGSESSVLYQSVKEDKQLVDDIDSDIFSGKFGGMLVISANVREGKTAEVLQTIFRQIDLLKKSGVSSDQLQRIKSDINREQSKENMQVENMASNLGYYETLGDYKMYYTYNDAIKRVIEPDIKEVMNKYLDTDSADIVLYYPEKKESEFKKLQTADDVRKLMPPAVEKKQEATGVVTKTVLDNGIILIHKKLDNTSIVDMKFSWRGGIVYEGSEDGEYKGITNLMLSSMLKGTAKLNATQLANTLDDLGAVLNKDIKRDSYGWAAEVVNTNLEKFMDVLSDITLHPSFDPDEVYKEKKDITNQIEQIKDNPPSYLNKIFNYLFFEWHPYGFPMIGEADTVRRASVKRIRQWHDDYMTPNNLYVTVVGNVDLEVMKSLINNSFKGWKKGKDLKPKLPMRITNEMKTTREVIDKNQSHIMIGFLGPKSSSEDYFPFRVLDTILSGGMDSRLFSEIREKRNLCYTIYSSFDRNVENGAFRIYTATSPENEKTAIKEIFRVLKDLYDNGVTDAEMKSAKSYISGMYKVGLQDYMAQADSYVSYEIWGIGYKKMDEFLSEIDKVKKQQVNAVIKKYIKLENYTQAVVGPAEKKGKKNDKDKDAQ